MNDVRFKWITGCTTIAVISIAAMILLPPKRSASRQARQKEVGEYVYLEKYRNVIHVDRKCKRLNYKGVESTRIPKEEVREDASFCPNCVDDASYKELTNSGR